MHGASLVLLIPKAINRVTTLSLVWGIGPLDFQNRLPAGVR